MFCANVFVRETLRFFSRISQHPLALIAQRQVHRGGNLFADGGVSLDLLANRLHRSVGAQEAIGQGFIFAQKSQQQMLCLNIRRPKLAGFITRKKDDATRLLRIAFKHITLSPEFQERSCDPASRTPCRSYLMVQSACQPVTSFISQLWPVAFSY